MIWLILIDLYSQKLFADYLSTDGVANTPDGTFEDTDLFVVNTNVNPPQLQSFLNGASVSLRDVSEDINGIWYDAANSLIFLTTEGSFAVNGSSGDGADIIICDRNLGSSATDCVFLPGLFWNGSAHGLGYNTIDALFLSDDHLLANCPAFSNGGFEYEFYCWAKTENQDPANGLWQLTTSEKHSGQYSAEAQVERVSSVHLPLPLTSSPIQVNSNSAYRFRFWVKTAGGDPAGTVSVHVKVNWYSGHTYQAQQFASIFYLTYPEWTEIDSGFLCPPSPEVDSARIVFTLSPTTLAGVTGGYEATSIFIDDVTWTAGALEPPGCPALGQD